MSDVPRLLAEYDAWCDERTRYAETDGSLLEGPTANEWAASDDSAVDLLHRLATALRHPVEKPIFEYLFCGFCKKSSTHRMIAGRSVTRCPCGSNNLLNTHAEFVGPPQEGT
jgi:hypothetical protein